MTNSQALCFHCQQIIPAGTHIVVLEKDHRYNMCCLGCKAITETIFSAGLAHYYDNREIPALKPNNINDLIPESLRNELELYDHPDIVQQYTFKPTHNNSNTIDNNKLIEIFLVIENIVCPACIWLIEKHIAKLDGVSTFKINYSTHRADLIFDINKLKLSQILIHIQQIGFNAYPLNEAKEQLSLKAARNTLLKQFAVAALCSMQVMMLAIALYFGDYQSMSPNTRYFLRLANFIISIPCITYASWPFYRAAIKDLSSKRLSMDVNISIAILLGSIASIYNTISNTGEIYFDSVTMFAFLLLGSRLIEMNARYKAITITSHILKVKPQLAHKIQEDGTIIDIASAQLAIDDIILIKPGETVPADGLLLETQALVDESLLTGESLPINKKQGDTIIGASINTDQVFTMCIKKVGNETVLSQMQRLIERASHEKPKIADLADKISSQFVIALLISCLFTYLAWLYINPAHAFETTLAVLVISCPCALALATPAALSAGNQSLIRLGLISTRAHALDTLNKVSDIIFDKTGTLTEGNLNIIEIIPCENTDTSIALTIACSLEAPFMHPIAKAFHKHAPQTLLQVEQLNNIIGSGISGIINSKHYELGAINDERYQLLNIHHTGSSIIELRENAHPLAYFILQDSLKPDAQAAIEKLAPFYQLHILSGDTLESIQLFNQALHIPKIQARCSPEDKMQYVSKLQQEGAVVLMLGDGLNDSPVLAKADVSIAMASGAALTQTHADMILLSERLMALPKALEFAKTTQSIIKQNLFWALLYNLIALPIAMGGFVVPWVAALGMSASSLIVITNTLRLQQDSD